MWVRWCQISQRYFENPSHRFEQTTSCKNKDLILLSRCTLDSRCVRKTCLSTNLGNDLGLNRNTGDRRNGVGLKRWEAISSEQLGYHMHRCPPARRTGGENEQRGRDSQTQTQTRHVHPSEGSALHHFLALSLRCPLRPHHTESMRTDYEGQPHKWHRFNDVHISCRESRH